MRIRSLIAGGLLVAGASIALAPTGFAESRAAAGIAPAQAAQLDEMSAAKRKRTRRGAQAYGASSGTQIACTRFGCNPIPRGCQIVGGRTWDGAPSGFDDVVCPYR
jgi:hypothetical protein